MNANPTEINVRADWRYKGLLTKTERAQPADRLQRGLKSNDPSAGPTLVQMELAKADSSRDLQLAAMSRALRDGFSHGKGREAAHQDRVLSFVQAIKPFLTARFTFSSARVWRPAVVARSARTLGLAIRVCTGPQGLSAHPPWCPDKLKTAL